MVTEQQVWEVLRRVEDPEIPGLSVVDLGMILQVSVDPDQQTVTVLFTPTFAACPAIPLIRQEIAETIQRDLGIARVKVQVSYDQPWDSNRITEQGRAILRKRGFAPPPYIQSEIELEVLQTVQCPYCGSINTELRSPFGPTLCRAIHYCYDCQQSFEQFKPVR